MIKNKLIIISVLSVFIILITCKELKKEMFVLTGDVTNILTTSAVAAGQIIDLGGGTTQYGHCYAKTPDVSLAGSKTLLNSPAGTGDFTSQLTNLDAGTKYYIKAYISNGSETAYGKEKSFSTASTLSPVTVTTAATSVTNTSATLNGTVNANNFSTTVTFEYGLTTSYGSVASAAPSPVSGSTVTNVSASLTGLPAGTLYHFRVKGFSTEGTSYGTDLTFTTTSLQPPTATTTAATSVSTTTATLNGTVNANNLSATVTFEYGLTTSYGSTANATPSPVTGNTPTGVSASVTGLSAGNLYHYRVKAASTGGTDYGSDLNFTTITPAPNAPSNLNAEAPDPAKINLTWSDNSNNETGFEIQRMHPVLGTWDGTWVTVTTVGPNVASYTHSGLSETWPGYQVRAINGAVPSAFSNTALAPAKIRIINNLYSTTPTSGNDWYRLNAIVRVRFGPTEVAVTADGNTYERLCPYDNLSDANYLTSAVWINPAYNASTQYRDFPVSTFGYGINYYVYVECGYWDHIVVFGPPYYWLKTRTSVLNQYGICCVSKIAWTQITNHTSGYFVLTASDLGLPWGSYNNTVKGNNAGKIFDLKGPTIDQR